MADEPEPSPYAISPLGGYITKLPPEQMAQFMTWVKANNVPYDPSPTADYDMPGFWSALQAKDPRAVSSVDPYDQKLHFTDYFKTPYHKTFSAESKFAVPGAPIWSEDGAQLIDKNGNVVFDARKAGER
jgi:hypothetical protein